MTDSKEPKLQDVNIERYPIFMNEQTCITITEFTIGNGFCLADIFLQEYIDVRKQQGNSAQQILNALKGHCSINFLWHLKEAINKEIQDHNKEFGTSFPLDRPEKE